MMLNMPSLILTGLPLAGIGAGTEEEGHLDQQDSPLQQRRHKEVRHGLLDVGGPEWKTLFNLL